MAWPAKACRSRMAHRSRRAGIGNYIATRGTRDRGRPDRSRSGMTFQLTESSEFWSDAQVCRRSWKVILGKSTRDAVSPRLIVAASRL
jgi:hypothetical protein